MTQLTATTENANATNSDSQETNTDLSKQTLVNFSEIDADYFNKLHTEHVNENVYLWLR